MGKKFLAALAAQTTALALLLTFNGATALSNSVRVDGGWYDARFAVPVMHLEGSIEEVARAHGALLAKTGVRPRTLYFFRKW